MVTKTDLAKFENVFDDHPRWVNLGSQKNFARYALRIGKEWEKSSDGFNEFYFKRAIARGILFRAVEKLVSAQPWYNGGYRANIVAYTLSMLGEVTKRRKTTVDYQRIWSAQAIDDVLSEALATIATAVNEDITRPPQGISNISEWCKREGCWTRLLDQADHIADLLPEDFWLRSPQPTTTGTKPRPRDRRRKSITGSRCSGRSSMCRQRNGRRSCAKAQAAGC
jgi:hypothetical protein